MKGQNLFNFIVDASKAEDIGIAKEFSSLLSSKGLKADQLDLPLLREIMVEYLQESLPKIKKDLKTNVK